MHLDNQLAVYEGDHKSDRMCGDVKDVAYFLQQKCNYRMNDVEYQAVQKYMLSVLPPRVFKESEKKRFLYVVDSSKNIHEWEEDQPLPDGWFTLAIIYRNSYSDKFGTIARFFFRSGNNPLTVNFNRRNSSESLPIFVADRLWHQFLEHFEDPYVPYVDTGFLPFDDEYAHVQARPFAGYTMKIEDESFQIKNKEDLIFCLQTLIGHDLCEETLTLLDFVFRHLENFPKEMVSSPMVRFYTDGRKMVYLGGDGTNGTRDLIYAGKLFPAFFTGLPGNVFLVRLGLFESERFNFIVVRN